ncbi:HET-domain-containing protein [Amniculicola lignicola CBS 123094]|uniref:HET-domain-containing protein n=1 Tax=Amniculicola lignicola CBS 123094 TaxID=1392246 RepID=A0A6A5W5P7_9PLEO|nr:HET-domain-containing protein [Amniculicola lignicola CBS 123094]
MDPPDIASLTLSDESAPYEYSDLPSTQHIRVLNLKPSHDPNAPLYFGFEVGLIDELEDAYEALSYTWGAAVFPHKLYSHDMPGHFLKITSNLNDALRKLRRPCEDRWIWADAVCINQGNSEEKNFQIPMMGDIYKRARGVVVWLGQGDEEVESAITGLSKLSRMGWDAQKRADVKESRLDSLALERVVNLVYFSRRWIIQELVMNLDVKLLYGKACISWIRFQSAFRSIQLRRIADTSSVKVVSRIITLWNHWMKIHKLSGHSERDDRVTQSLGVFALLSTLESSHCVDSRDILYTLATLATDIHITEPSPEERKPKENIIKTISMGINYADSVETVFCNFARAAISANNGSQVLQALFSRPRSLASMNPRFPSWVPDWRIPASDDYLRGGLGEKEVSLILRQSDQHSFGMALTVKHTHRFPRLRVSAVLPPHGELPCNLTAASKVEIRESVQRFWTSTAHTNQDRKETPQSPVLNPAVILLQGIFPEDSGDISRLYGVFQIKEKYAKQYRVEGPVTLSNLYSPADAWIQTGTSQYSLFAARADRGWVLFGFTQLSPSPGDRLLIYDVPRTSAVHGYSIHMALLLRPLGEGILSKRYHLLGSVTLMAFNCLCTPSRRSSACGFMNPSSRHTWGSFTVELG